MTVNRTAFYVLALFTALLQSVFGTLTGFVAGDSPHLYIFGKLAGALALVTWIWIAILIKYNRTPQSTNPLCRSYAHLMSFAVFGVSWLGIGIMLAAESPWECRSQALWCTTVRFSTALAFLTSISSIIAACFIYRSANSFDVGLAVNVDKASNKHLTAGI